MTKGRAIGSELLNELCKGELKAFLDGVNKNEKELLLCQRYLDKNTNNMITVYHNNHIVFQLQRNSSYYTVTVSSHHAKDKKNERVLEDFQKKLIDELGFQEADKDGYMKCKTYWGDGAQKFSGFYENYLKGAMRSYFQKNTALEKRRQQQIFLSDYFKSQKNGYYIFDIEYQKPHINKVAQVMDKNDRKNNKPDFLAVLLDDNGHIESYVIGEVKSTKGAMEQGESSLKNHIDKMEKSFEYNLEETIKGAINIINNYNELNMYKAPKLEADKQNIDDIKKEILIVLTDEVKNEWDNNIPDKFIYKGEINLITSKNGSEKNKAKIYSKII